MRHNSSNLIETSQRSVKRAIQSDGEKNRNNHRNKIISVISESAYRTGKSTEMISFLSLFLVFKSSFTGTSS